jgi:peroxiredoxin Q/BCP
MLMMLAATLVGGGAAASRADDLGGLCRSGDRGRLMRFERVASHPTAADARAYFDSWVAFYQDFHAFPPNLLLEIAHGFDSYKVTYCTVDAVLPGQVSARPTVATGNISVPRKSGRLSTVVYQHGTAVSFYDAPSNPNVFGEFSGSTDQHPSPGGPMLNPGDKAPDFTGRDHNGNPVKLSDYKGKTVVLWFYPKADTPG